MTLSAHDFAGLEARWITPELARQAGLFRVDSADGAQLVGRNGAGDYSGIAIPNIRPGQTHAREYALRLDHPDLELRSDGTTRPKARYLNPPGRGNRLYMPPGTPAPWLQETSLPMVVVEGPFKALAVQTFGRNRTYTSTNLQTRRQCCLFRRLSSRLTNRLVQQVFKHRTLAFKTIRTDVCQVVGNHIHVGLLRVQAGFGDP